MFPDDSKALLLNGLQIGPMEGKVPALAGGLRGYMTARHAYHCRRTSTASLILRHAHTIQLLGVPWGGARASRRSNNDYGKQAPVPPRIAAQRAERPYSYDGQSDPQRAYRSYQVVPRPSTELLQIDLNLTNCFLNPAQFIKALRAEATLTPRRIRASPHTL